MVMKSFQYRVYPTKQQVTLLSRHLEECRWLWNTLLAERRTAWEERQESVSYLDQQNALPALKATVRPGLQGVHSLVVQDVARRLDKAFAAFFRRVHAGETPGYPRFRGTGRYASLTYPQWENGVKLEHERLLLSKVGQVKLLRHRPLEGTPKTVTIRRTRTGKWFVTITCEWEPTPLPPTGMQVGLDMGLHIFCMRSTGQSTPNPRFFQTEEQALAKAQRRFHHALDAHTTLRETLTTQAKVQHPNLDTKAIWQVVSQDPAERVVFAAREAQRRVVARVHERTRWRRGDFTHQESRRLVNQYGLIAVEALDIVQMVHTPGLAKSIHDVAWREHAHHLTYKAAWAGRHVVAVNPAYTSQACSGCGHRKSDLTLRDRTYHCTACGLVLDRDHNAAVNILRLGQQSLAQA